MGILKTNLFKFEGVSNDQGTFFTPDCNGAVNADYFVEFINGSFSIYTKDGALTDRVEDWEFWASAGIGERSDIVDPRIVFIPDAGSGGQWLAVQLDLGNKVRIATTNPSDQSSSPRIGNWRASQFDLPGNDFTMLGYDAHGVYISVNSSNGQSQEREPQIVFLLRTEALSYPPIFDHMVITEPLPLDQFGTNLFPAIDHSRAGWPYQTFIGVDNLTGRHLTWSLFWPSERIIISHGKIEVEPFTPLQLGTRVRQPQDPVGTTVIYSGSLTAAPQSDGFNIWLAQTVILPGTDQPYQPSALAIRWYHLYIDPVTRIPGLASSGEISDPLRQFDYFNPSIISLGKDDYTIVSFSRSGVLTDNPNDPNCGNIGAYAAILRESGSGTMTEILTVQPGLSGNYYGTNGQRWGDYCTTCRDPDPQHPRKVWTTNEYVRGIGGGRTNAWGTIIASLELDRPPS